jgi:hypothetical protein
MSLGHGIISSDIPRYQRQVLKVDNAVTVDVRLGVKSGLTATLAEAGPDNCEVEIVNDTVSVKVRI